MVVSSSTMPSKHKQHSWLSPIGSAMRGRQEAARTSWRNKTTRGQCNERTRRGDATTSWRNELLRGRHTERATRGYASTSWHVKVTRGRRDERRHNLVVFWVQTESTGKGWWRWQRWTMKTAFNCSGGGGIQWRRQHSTATVAGATDR